MKRLLLVPALVLFTACSTTAPGAVTTSAPPPAEPEAALPPGVTALPIDSKLVHCQGDSTNRAAVIRIDKGPRFWEVIPGQLESPELTAVDEPLIMVIYPEGWPGAVLGAPGVPRPTHRPGTWDICVEVESGAHVLGGIPVIVYANVAPAGARITGP